LGIRKVGGRIEVMDEVVNWLEEDSLFPKFGVGFEVVVLVQESVAS
tara:strand:- start:37 stop:174 length:138 start_codon:yes stop_codon:yes gene_type:complete